MRTFVRWMRVALTDLRGDTRRFGVLLGCLALGCATIAAVGSVGAALQDTVVRDASQLLGADIEASRADRRATEEELSYFRSLGTVAETTDTNTLGASATDSAFLDLLGVGENYPLFGNVRSPQLAQGESPAPLLAEKDGVFGAMVDPVLLDRLGIDLGGRFHVGDVEFEVRALLGSVPDGAVRSFHIGLTTLVPVAALDLLPDMRLPMPGLLTQHRYKIRLFEGTYEDVEPELRAHLASDPEWTIRTPYDAAGSLARFYDRFVRYLIIVGLSSLLVGGVGIWNAVGAYIEERQRSIATMRSLGATGARILVHVFTQIGVMSVAGIAIGLVIGAVATVVALPIIGPMIGVDLRPTVDWPSLATAAGFGALAAFAFSYVPLVRARKLKPAMLFRTVGTSVEALPSREWLTVGVLVPLGLAGLGIFALAVLATHDTVLVVWYAAGAIGAFVVLRLAAAGMQAVLRALPPSPNKLLRTAQRSICRTGSPAPVVVLSLGLGLAVLLVIAILNANLHYQLLNEVQKDAPTFVVSDLFADEVPEIRDFLDKNGVLTSYLAAPMVRATITKVKGIPSDQFTDLPEEAAFMLEGEIPISWSAEVPAQSRVTEGKWWPPDYHGPPLVSLRDRARGELGLKVGDTIELTVLGEKIEATIASFRDYQFRNGINFLVTLSPGALDGLPQSWLALIKTAEGTEKDSERNLVRQFPELMFIPVGDALDQAADLLGQLGNAVNVVGLLAVINGLLVLAGTMAAGRKQREADGVVSKVLGATRADVVRAFAIEYAVLGAFAAVLAAAMGVGGAYAITRAMIDIDFGVDPVMLLGVLAGAVALTIATGAATTWKALSSRPAQYLRSVG